MTNRLRCLIARPNSRFALLAALACWTQCFAATSQADDSGSLVLHARYREPSGDGFTIGEKLLRWDPRKTAVVICDMWDRHWCQGATQRVAEMAPRVNEVTAAARRQGILVIHCPSDTMKFYQDAPQRKLAQQAPKAPLKPLEAGWCPLADGKEPPLPFDNSHDRCDCAKQCPHGNPWRRQIESIVVADDDAITDNQEAFYLMKQRGIENVVVLGVHANMCVLGRPFSIRQMAAQGQNVVLMRDLTDSMHDSQMPPLGLDHFRATELVVEHIEKYWCPSITSSDFAGGPAFHFQEDSRPHVVFLIGEDEYKTEKTLPLFAEQELAPRGVRSSCLHSNPEDLNDFPGTETLESADLLFVSVRRRALPKIQLDRLRAFVGSGKPVAGIRTASHAFALRAGSPPPAGHELWPEFDAQVLGGNYQGHHDANLATEISVSPQALGHPILAGLPEIKNLKVGSSLYKNTPLADSATALLTGTVAGFPAEPVAWTNARSGGGRTFYTSLGHIDDFALPEFRRLLVNGVFWALDQDVPDALNEKVAAAP